MAMQQPPTVTPVTSGQNEAAAITRHAVSFGSGIFTVLGVLAVVPADQVQKAIAILQDAGSHIQALVGDVVALIPIVTSAFAVISAWYARTSASLPGQLKSITSNPAVYIPPGSTIEVSAAVAAQVPSSKVVPPFVPPA